MYAFPYWQLNILLEEEANDYTYQEANAKRYNPKKESYVHERNWSIVRDEILRSLSKASETDKSQVRGYKRNNQHYDPDLDCLLDYRPMTKPMMKGIANMTMEGMPALNDPDIKWNRSVKMPKSIYLRLIIACCFSGFAVIFFSLF